MNRLPLLVIASVVFGAAISQADDAAAGRCQAYDRLRRPFFGDLHVHTASSIDAFVFDVVNTPRDAYAFARGGTVAMTPIDVDHQPTRTWKLRRPLDFTAVTDHSEGFGITKVCTTPGTLAYDLPECQILRGVIPTSALPNPNGAQFTLHRAIGQATLIFLIAQVGVVPPNLPTTCRLFPDQCDAGAVSIWQDEQDAAKQYDDPCNFTTFVAYEWTPMPATANLHRNVIFRNEKVPGKPISYYDTVTFDARVLWSMLGSACLDPQTGVPGCDVLTIPHNSNLSLGLMFPDPHDAKEAADRAVWEPLVEITQHKGSSECRFDRMYGSGVDTTDEQCAFEQEPSLTLLPNQYLPPPPQEAYPPRAVVRSVLDDRLALEQQGFDDPANPGAKLHINPFKLGVMGSDLPPPPLGKKPRFVAWALKDEGVLDDSGSPVPGTGTPLQRIQIVKGWVDGAGATHERVLNIAPTRDDGSLRPDGSFSEDVDPQTCRATTTGSG